MRYIALLVITVGLIACVFKYALAPAPLNLETAGTVPEQYNCLKDPLLTNDQIIEETHKCESNGLVASGIVCNGHNSIIRIQCEPKQEIAQ